MHTQPAKVLIVGAGLAGLCLAHGLRRAGMDVRVFERDHASGDRLQGYRIHIEPQGNRALAACLPPHLLAEYLSSAGSAGSGHRIVTEQLRQLVFFRAPQSTGDPLDRDLSVSRITLREILLAELEPVVSFGAAFARYRELPDGTVRAEFEDGSSACGDLLVAADGSNSRIFRQFFPTARRPDTGVGAIMGKLPLTDEVRSLLVPGKLDGATSIFGPRGVGMFLALHELGQARVLGATAGEPPAGFLMDNQSDYLFWACIARHGTFPSRLSYEQDGAALKAATLEMIVGWHPTLRRLVAEADPATVIYKPLRTAAPLRPWQTRRVTFMGDAIHSMPPTRGIGGNTALRDASLLCAKLRAVQAGETPLLRAVHEYEREMLRYGFAAVRSSLQSMQLMVARRRLVGNTMLRLVGLAMRG